MNLAIIGAAGIMGSYSARALALKTECLSAYDICSREKLEQALDRTPCIIREHPEEAVQNADAVLFCVPTDSVERSMAEVLPLCKRGAIIAGQTSRKAPERAAFDEYMNKNSESKLEMVTIHTMCDPSKSDASREILVWRGKPTAFKLWMRAPQSFSTLNDYETMS